MKILYALGYMYVAAGAAWRTVCLFRKKGSCRFRGCPFRKDYTSSSCIYFPSGGCAKCPPTESEKAAYGNSAEGIVEAILEKGRQEA